MLQLDQAKAEIAALQKSMAEIRDAMDIGSLNKEHEELSLEMASPGFWDNVDKAQKVNQNIRYIENRLKAFNSLNSRVEDAAMLIEIACEENDTSILGDLEGEIANLFKETESMVISTMLTGEYDANNAIVSLNSGAGGTEAQDWTEMLYRMYRMWGEANGYNVTELDYLAGNEAGIKSVTFLVEGPNAYGYLKSEKGVHRLVRISPFDASARRHTSFASCEVMPEVESSSEVEINPDDLKVDTYKSSGAGGQHVNKTSSAVRITHLPTGIVVACQNERSQIQNRETAMKMLISKLVEIKERENMEKLADIKGEIKKIEWGSQIRSYVFHPYKLVKDHRTNIETSNVNAVMDGGIDLFINGYLKMI